jgi:vesicle coat complex subunit
LGDISGVYPIDVYSWLQVFILDTLVNYQVQDSKDAEKIVERVLPRLQHVNSAVVLSAAKVGGRLCLRM